jgi:hypothetical protein
MNIPTPKPITHWETSDGKVHPTEEMARCHEVFLHVKGALPNNTSGSAAYPIITALARRFDFVERK